MILNPSLRAYVRHHAEDRPGIYRMLGPEKEILYVGKSVRVKSRLLSYFRAEPAGESREADPGHTGHRVGLRPQRVRRPGEGDATHQAVAAPLQRGA